MSHAVVVAGHELPATLHEQMIRGSWPPMVTPPRLREVFGEDPDPSATWYSLDEMEGETARWQHETDPAYLGLGEETLDPATSILIGDLGFDRPIAIDLRVSPSPVRLLTLEGRWRVVADSVELLLGLLSPGNTPT